MEWAPSVNDIADACPLDMLLLTLYFYNTLPMFIPQADLLFSAKIHQKIIQTISLTNPTSKPITYSIRLDGSTNFKVHSDSITIEGRAEYLVKKQFAFIIFDYISIYDLPVEFCTPFSVQSEARLMLQSKRVLHTANTQASQRIGNGLDSSVVVSPASILIFRLKSSVDPSLPHKQLNFTAKMYPERILL